MDDLEQPATPDSELPDTTADSEQHDAPETADNEAEGDALDAEEEAELEVGDRKIALPKSVAEKLQAERLMQADYTRKTQEVAATRQQLEQQAAQLAQDRQTQQQFIDDIAKVKAIDDQLAVFDKVDWQKLIAENPQDAMMYQEQRRALEAERNAKHAEVTQKQQQFALNEQQSFAKQVQDAEAYVQREIPGGEERTKQLHEYAAKEGVKFDPQVAKALFSNPMLFKMIHKAELYDRLEKKQTAKPAIPPAPPPATRVSATRQGVQKDPAKMSTDEWMAHRTAQLTRKR